MPGAAEKILPGLDDLKARAAKAGRDMKTISVSVFGAAPDEAVLDTYRKAGITRALFRLPSESRETILPQLDRLAKLIK